MPHQFASDNNAGLCPEALAALADANVGHAAGYGDDDWSRNAVAAIRAAFETDAQVFFAATGTAANALLLCQMLRPYDAVLAHRHAHIEEDEAGAVGFFTSGAKIALCHGAAAKVTPADVARFAEGGRGVHHVRPRALSLTQATELGTVYTPDELRQLTEAARAHGLKVHMDGARFANAVASLGCRPAEISWRAGVDALTFGGVKNGLACGEALVVFDATLADGLAWRLKQSGHLFSKQRFVTAPWAAVLETGAWLRHAAHANAMARRLGEGLARLGVALSAPVEANAVFADLGQATQAALRGAGWRFYTFLPPTGCRLMCAWDTPASTVDRFLTDLAADLGARSQPAP